MCGPMWACWAHCWSSPAHWLSIANRYRGWLLLMLTMGFYALGLRHNALPALLPLVVFAVQRFLAEPRSIADVAA